MNRNLRTISALMRHTWGLEPVWADQHLPLVDAYLSGKLASVAIADEEQNRPIGYVLGADGGRIDRKAAAEGEESDQYWDRPYADPNLPEGSIAILDVRGAIMKEGTCCSYGTEDYCQMLDDIYANDKIIGTVIMMDSPGGQLSGTPSVYDQTRRADKPCVGYVSEGLCASAALWWLVGCDYILASQKTDQIGSIGVFVRLRDNSAALEKQGIRELTIYSDLSPEKNSEYREALAGNDKPMKEDLNEAARLFRAAVEEGRAGKLNLSAGDPFKGKLYYASKAQEIGLIDGFGTLTTAVEKVRELATTRKGTSTPATPAARVAESAPDTAPVLVLEVQEGDSDNENSNSNPSTAMPFGYKKVTALTAVAALASADEVTPAHIDAINAEFAELGVEGVTAVSDADAAKLASSQTEINRLTAQVAQLTADKTTLTDQVSTLTQERDDAKKKAEQFGDQPGAVASKTGKTDEKTAGTDEAVISETDAELQKLKASLKQPGK